MLSVPLMSPGSRPDVPTRGVEGTLLYLTLSRKLPARVTQVILFPAEHALPPLVILVRQSL